MGNETENTDKLAETLGGLQKKIESGEDLSTKDLKGVLGEIDLAKTLKDMGTLMSLPGLTSKAFEAIAILKDDLSNLTGRLNEMERRVTHAQERIAFIEKMAVAEPSTRGAVLSK